jgi:signal transduction histidine kinase
MPSIPTRLHSRTAAHSSGDRAVDDRRHGGRSRLIVSRCHGDALRLWQVLLNLLTNAIKFTEAGTVTLSASLCEPKLVFTITITDTGICMNAQELGGLFASFQQANGSTTRWFGGTGLGLVLMHARRAATRQV